MKKTAPGRQASLPLEADYTKAFLKDWTRLARAGRYDLARLKEAMMRLIANDGPLGPEWFDHPLKGDLAGLRECHVGGDFLLLYQLDGKAINFVRAGSHAELYGG